MNGVDFVAFVAFGTVEPLLKGERIFQHDVDKKVVMYTFMVVIFLYLQRVVISIFIFFCRVVGQIHVKRYFPMFLIHATSV